LTAAALQPANAVRPIEPRPQNWPNAPALIEPHPNGLVCFETLEALADRCAELLRGRGFFLNAGMAGYPPFTTFAKVTLWATGGTNNRPEEWLGAAVLLDPRGPAAEIEILTAAIGQAQAGKQAR
jgi:hypothetical protein